MRFPKAQFILVHLNGAYSTKKIQWDLIHNLSVQEKPIISQYVLLNKKLQLSRQFVAHFIIYVRICSTYRHNARKLYIQIIKLNCLLQNTENRL